MAYLAAEMTPWLVRPPEVELTLDLRRRGGDGKREDKKGEMERRVKMGRGRWERWRWERGDGKGEDEKGKMGRGRWEGGDEKGEDGNGEMKRLKMKKVTMEEFH